MTEANYPRGFTRKATAETITGERSLYGKDRTVPSFLARRRKPLATQSYSPGPYRSYATSPNQERSEKLRKNLSISLISVPHIQNTGCTAHCPVEYD